MLLKQPSVHFQSLTELKRYSSVNSFISKPQKQNQDNYIKSSSLKKRNSQFIPFYKQRDLGKLILNKNKLTQSKAKRQNVKDLFDSINFRNFKKLYNMQKRNQQAKYALKIRDSGQIDLINSNQWEIKDLFKRSGKTSIHKSQLKQTNYSQKIQRKINYLRNCCNQKGNLHLQKKSEKINQNFIKIDTQLYKKIALNRPPSGNPQLEKLFRHYVQACELNQNERRRFLTQRTK